MTTSTSDSVGRRRSPATYPDYHAGRAPRNKGRRYPADPPRVEEIMAVMREAGERPPGIRLRGLIVVLWTTPTSASPPSTWKGSTPGRSSRPCTGAEHR